MDIGNYQRLIWRLIYILHACLDISYAVNNISQSPRVSHLQRTHRVFRFLKETTKWGLSFKHQRKLTLDMYLDSNFTKFSLGCRSTMASCSFLVGNLITRRRKKQGVISRLSIEAEFKVMARGLANLV